MKVLELGHEKFEHQYQCATDGGGTTNCKGCEDMNESVEKIQKVYSQEQK